MAFEQQDVACLALSMFKLPLHHWHDRALPARDLLEVRVWSAHAARAGATQATTWLRSKVSLLL